ncbi:hypothetical protein OIU78_014354 [Salix suchowensis]|nr:hypothetical protein OIU78_014354 [Salix suchowensis]
MEARSDRACGSHTTREAVLKNVEPPPHLISLLTSSPFLPPDSLARARDSMPVLAHLRHFIPLEHRRINGPAPPSMFQPEPTRPVATIGSLILSRPADSTALRLAICNPLTKEFRYLPQLEIARTNPAVGVVILGPAQHSPFLHFRVYVAGGMSAAPRGAATYVPTVEVYDSEDDAWRIAGPMPVEFAVRLTVWTPNESVYSEGVLYWMTSARAYSIMGFEIKSNKWQELSVPMADKLEFAALAQLDGRLALVGGRSDGGDACVWELDERHVWSLKEKMPAELGRRMFRGQGKLGGDKMCKG